MTTTIELVSIIRKRGQPTRYILMIDDEPITIQYKVPKTVQTKIYIPTNTYLSFYRLARDSDIITSTIL